MDGSLGSFHYAAHEGVGGLVEDEGEGDAESGDAHIVIDRLHLHDVLARPGIADGGKGVEYELRVKGHS